MSTSQRVEPAGSPPRFLPTGGRLVGVDLARGLAVLGMFGAHIASVGPVTWAPESWLGLVHGRPSILFALLAGVSLAIISGRTAPVTGDERLRARTRILVRAVLIFAVGGVLEALGTYVAVILGVYAVLFVLTLPFLSWSARRLFVLAGVLSVLAPVADLLLRQLVWNASAAGGPFVLLTLTGPYPALIWWTFVVVGLGIGRLELTDTRVRLRLLAGGLGLALLGYGGGWLTTQWWADGRPSAGVEAGEAHPGTWDWAWLSGAAPHSGTPFEVIGSTGFAMAVLAASLLLAGLVPRLVYPVASVGTMALTVYSLHIVSIAAVIDQDRIVDNRPWLISVLVAIAFATLWRLTLGRGPLERLLTWTSHRAAAADGRAWPGRPPPPGIAGADALRMP